ncbi:hypothetical protein BDN72DRAFT_782022, partial [Pluteus cervinus]
MISDHSDAHNTLRIWQQNVAKSKMAMVALLNGKVNPMHKNFDVICLQEPWIDSKAPLTTATKNWSIIYPDIGGGDGEDKIRSIILVNAKMNTNNWSTFRVPGTADVTALQIKNEKGQKTTIFNIYNPGENISAI